MKRFLAVFLTLALLLTSLAAVASAAQEEGIYYDETAKKSYMITKDGVKATSWYNWKGTETYEDDGEVYEYEFDYWVLGGADGYLVEGWKQVGGVWYYFMPGWPIMVTGSWNIDNEYHLFGSDGAWQVSATQPGWVKSGNNWYYLMKQSDDYCDFIRSWDKEDTAKVVIGKKIYAFDYNGKLITNKWIETKYGWSDGASDWYYAEKSGELAMGWKQIGGKWYYFNKYNLDYYDDGDYVYGPWMYYNDTWRIYSGENDTKGTLYCFKKSGELLVNGWYHVEWNYEDGYSYDFWCHAPASGIVDTGWFKDGGKWYYADNWGRIYIDEWLTKDGVSYFFDESGAMATGWKQIGGDWFYFKASGAMAENEWVQDGIAWYYLGEGGAMYADGTYEINGTDYTFADNGIWIK